jgi:hypothetical protein
MQKETMHPAKGGTRSVNCIRDKAAGTYRQAQNVSFHFPSPLEKVAEGRMRLAELENLRWLNMLNR